jgi:putative transcriptional regulator
MLSIRRQGILGAAAVALVSVLVLGAAAPAAAQALTAGQLLVASPSIGDPRFHETVILMVRHDASGALGIVINRPIATRPLATLMELLGESAPAAAGEIRLFAGGPVQPEIGFVVHSADYRHDATIAVGAGIAVTSDRAILRDIATAKGPDKSLVAFGYAGWGPGQLEGELAARAWSIAPADARLVFDEDRARLWEAASTRRMQDL